MSRFLCAAAAAVLVLSAGLAHAADDPPARGGKDFDPERLFKRMDADGDGKVTADEFKAFFSKLPKLAEKPEIIQKIFDKLDADGDGKITMDEFKKIAELREKLQELREKVKGDK